MTTVALILAAVAILVVLFFARSRKPHSVTQLPEAPVSFGPELRRFIDAYTSTGTPGQVDPRYREALNGMRASEDAVLKEIAVLDRELLPSSYAVRRALVFAVSEMRTPAGLGFLRGIALRELPQASAPHMAHDAEQQTMLSLTAIEGIEKLAADANSAATEALVEAMNVSSLAVRAVALAALRATNAGGQAYERAVARLPPEQQYLRDVRRVSVEQVPQIRDPRRDLAGTVAHVVDPPILTEDVGRFPSRSRATIDGDAPRARRG
jgi:hypothetical protein